MIGQNKRNNYRRIRKIVSNDFVHCQYPKSVRQDHHYKNLKIFPQIHVMFKMQGCEIIHSTAMSVILRFSNSSLFLQVLPTVTAGALFPISL